MANKLHGKIAADLRQLITSGQLGPGDYLPTETALITKYGVSRNTVRNAVAALTNDGLIEHVPGRGGGMRVRQRIVLTHYASRAELPGTRRSESDTFFGEVRAQGFEPSQDFELRIEALTPELAEMLEVEPGSPAAVRRCLRRVNGRPTSIQATYYPQWLTDLVPELLSPHDIPIGTTELLRQKGFDQIAYIDPVAARMPTPEEADALDLQPGTPVLEHLRRGVTAEATVRVSVEILAGDSNRLFFTIGDPEALQRALEPDE